MEQSGARKMSQRSHLGLPTETFAFLSGVSSSFRTDKAAAFLLAPRLTLLDNVQSRKAPVPRPGRAETPAAPLISLPISPQPNTHPTLESPEISSRRQGVLWLYAGPPIAAFLEEPLSNVGHFVRISFCVNMQRWISVVCLSNRDKCKLIFLGGFSVLVLISKTLVFSFYLIDVFISLLLWLSWVFWYKQLKNEEKRNAQLTNALVKLLKKFCSC